MMNYKLTLWGAFMLFQTAFGQTTRITGRVVDSHSAETLPGATLIIEGTQLAASTDFDGNYTLTGLGPGHYKMVCRMIGYTTKIIDDIHIKTGDKVLNIDITLETSSQSLSEVIVTASMNRESVNTMMVMQKNSAAVQDGISAQAIKNTPDKNTSEVLKRISGTTIQDNRFVIVRGLNERYNAAFINGVPLPSSESDRKAFAFDLFPSSILDNLVVIKSATPEMPADFSGGVIQINTKSIPDHNAYAVSLSAGYHTLSSFKKFYSYPGGKLDRIGVDDGKRALPDGLPETKEFRAYTIPQKAEAAKLMPNDWGLNTFRSGPARNFQYYMGNTARFGKNQFGSVVSLTCNQGYSLSRSVRRDYLSPLAEEKPQQEFELTDSSFSVQVSGGALANFSLQMGNNHQVSFKNLYTINSEDKVVIRNGIRDYGQTPYRIEKSSIRSFTENRLYSGQLTGEHMVSKIRIKWVGGYSDIIRSIPNLRRMIYEKNSAKTDPGDPYEPEPVFKAAIPNTGTSPSYGGNIVYSENHEKIYSGNYSLSYDLPELSWLKTELRTGAMHQLRDREFSARQFGFTSYSVFGGSKPVFFDSRLLELPEDKIFAPENMGLLVSGKGGFKFEEATKLNDSYEASSVLHAGYLMADQRFFERFRLVWGARVESYSQRLNSFEDDGTEILVDTTVTDLLPSGNLIFSATEKTNLRFSYAQTVGRPEFRELAPFGFFDFVTFYTVRGNPALQRARVYNYDLRYEIFPGAGQILSVSAFYKKFVNAIEQVNGASDSRQLDYRNVPRVDSYGAEMEFRVNVGSILRFDSLKFLSNLFLYSNIAYIQSEVDVSQIPGSIGLRRPLQGQSPYIINGGIQYYDAGKQFGFSAVLNKVGRRISIVGNTGEPDLWENPRMVIDLQLSKTFFKKLEAKINIKDMLSQDLVFYQDSNANKKMDLLEDNIMSETNSGKTISLGLSFKF